MAQAKTARWLDLIAFLLQHRYPVTRQQIFEQVQGYRPADESSRRKFERDKDELRSLGIEIETVSMPDAEGDEPTAAYRLKPRDFYLPYLELTENQPERPYAGLRQVRVHRDEIEVLDRATQRLARREEVRLAEAARSARRKLAFDLPIEPGDAERMLARPMTGEGQESLAALQSAAAERRAVTCRYYGIGRDAEAEREIEPYGLFFTWGRWYAVARARDRDAERVFRVDRMRDVQPLKGRSASFAVPEDFSIESYVGRAPWELGENAPEEVRVRFRFPESRWVLAQRVGEPVDPLLDDGGALIAFSVRDRNPMLRWLLTFRGQAEIVAPADLAKELEGLRARVRALYA